MLRPKSLTFVHNPSATAIGHQPFTIQCAISNAATPDNITTTALIAGA
jgi:hypothetical protein